MEADGLHAVSYTHLDVYKRQVLISGKKACGILPETRFIGDRIEFAVVGIGVNVAVRKDLLPPEVRETSGSLISPDHPHACLLYTSRCV